MIVDRLPLNMGKVTPLSFAVPAVAVKVVGPPLRYVYDLTSSFIAEGGSLYLFDSYSMCASITEQQFAAAVGAGAASVTDNAYVPALSITFPGTQGGRPQNFPTIYPAFFGTVPIRAFGMSPSDQQFNITPRIKGTLIWDTVAYPTAPDSVTFLYGLNVYQIKDQKFIDAYLNSRYELS